MERTNVGSTSRLPPADLRTVFGVGVERVLYFCIHGTFDLDDLRLSNAADYTQGWDAENRLITVTVSGQTTTFVYDGDGKRVKKVENGVATYYAGEYYEKEGSAVTKHYCFEAQRLAMRAAGVVQYLHADHLGSTSLATCGSGSACGGNGAAIPNSRTWYKPYGEVRGGGSALPTDRQFTGQRRESGIGLYDYNARYYDPLLARFISADTIVPSPSSPQSLNRYSYCLGNPVRYRDPTGHAADAGGGAGLTIEELLAIYERLYNEAPDALDPKGYAGWLKEYYNRKAALYQRLVEGRTPDEIESSAAYVEQAYGNLLRNGYYGRRVGLASTYLAGGGESAVSIPLTAGFTELGRTIWRGCERSRIRLNEVRPSPRDEKGLSFNITKEGAMQQSEKGNAAAFDADAIEGSGNWSIGNPDPDGHVNVARALDVQQAEWYNYYHDPQGPWQTAPPEARVHHPYTQELYRYRLEKE